jgi:hypothetical protein
MSPNVSKQAIVDALNEVPRERWSQVLSFIESLRANDEAGLAQKRRMTGADLVNSDLIGLWAHRADIGDSREFARQLREKAQTREHER